MPSYDDATKQRCRRGITDRPAQRRGAVRVAGGATGNCYLIFNSGRTLPTEPYPNVHHPRRWAGVTTVHFRFTKDERMDEPTFTDAQLAIIRQIVRDELGAALDDGTVTQRVTRQMGAALDRAVAGLPESPATASSHTADK